MYDAPEPRHPSLQSTGRIVIQKTSLARQPNPISRRLFPAERAARKPEKTSGANLILSLLILNGLRVRVCSPVSGGAANRREVEVPYRCTTDFCCIPKFHILILEVSRGGNSHQSETNLIEKTPEATLPGARKGRVFYQKQKTKHTRSYPAPRHITTARIL